MINTESSGCGCLDRLMVHYCYILTECDLFCNPEQKYNLYDLKAYSNHEPD